MKWIDQVLEISLARQPAGADEPREEVRVDTPDSGGDDVDRNGLTTH